MTTQESDFNPFSDQADDFVSRIFNYEDMSQSGSVIYKSFDSRFEHLK